MRNQFLVGVAGLVVCAGIAAWTWGGSGTRGQTPAEGATNKAANVPNKVASVNQTNVGAARTDSSVKVIAVGGSVAHGWDDKVGGGFLVRTFKMLSENGNTTYQFVNKSVEGYGPVQMAASYQSVLQAENPQILVISWGILDDLAKKTPIGKFGSAIHDEIASALALHKQVIVATTPITPASYSVHSGSKEARYVKREIAVAKSFHSQDVYVFDVFHQMKAYLKAHHQEVQQYAGDGWHPNSAGHELAAEMMVKDFDSQFLKSSP